MSWCSTISSQEQEFVFDADTLEVQLREPEIDPSLVSLDLINQTLQENPHNQELNLDEDLSIARNIINNDPQNIAWWWEYLYYAWQSLEAIFTQYWLTILFFFDSQNQLSVALDRHIIEQYSRIPQGVVVINIDINAYPSLAERFDASSNLLIYYDQHWTEIMRKVLSVPQLEDILLWI